MSIRKVIRALSTPVTLGILFAIMIGGVWWGYQIMTTKVVSQRTPCVTMPMSELTTSSVTVNIFNAGDQVGLASRIADVLRDGGYVIHKVGNTDEKAVTTLIIGTAINSPEVELVASWFVNPEIRADERIDHSVDILVGNGYEEEKGMASEPPTSITISGDTICLPATPTPTYTPTPTDKAPPTGKTSKGSKTPTPTATKT